MPPCFPSPFTFPLFLITISHLLLSLQACSLTLNFPHPTSVQINFLFYRKNTKNKNQGPSREHTSSYHLCVSLRISIHMLCLPPVNDKVLRQISSAATCLLSCLLLRDMTPAVLLVLLYCLLVSLHWIIPVIIKTCRNVPVL